MNKFSIIFVMAFCMSIGSCIEKGTIVDELFPYNTSAIEGKWRVEAFESVGGKPVMLNPVDTIWISFSDTGRVSGRSHGLCGNYFEATFLADSAMGLQIASLITTEALCPSSSYWQFINALQGVSRFSFTNRLYLYYDNETKRLWLSRITEFSF